MADVIQKYRERVRYTQDLADSYRDVVIATITHIRTLIKSSPDVDKNLGSLLERVNAAENIFQVKQILKDYTALRKEIALSVRGADNKGPGFFSSLLVALSSFSFSKKEKNESFPKPAALRTNTPAELVEAPDEELAPYLILLEGLSKGALVMGGEKQPFYKPLLAHMRKNFTALDEPKAKELKKQLYNFFIGASNEVQSAEKERGELKKVISSLTEYIRELSVSSEKFGASLKGSSAKIAKATTLDEIKKIQRVILSETDIIQKANNAVRAQLAKSDKRVRAAANRIIKLERALKQAREEKWTDALTQMHNRGYFDERLKDAVAGYKRDKEPVCLLIFDIDHFKQFNDTYGHQVGDKVLQVVAKIFVASVRSSDTSARYGGEEFVAILYKTEVRSAKMVAEVLRKNIEGHEFGIKGKTINVTATIGVTEIKPQDTGESLLKRADEGLYKGKTEGRNRVITA